MNKWDLPVRLVPKDLPEIKRFESERDIAKVLTKLL